VGRGVADDAAKLEDEGAHATAVGSVDELKGDASLKRLAVAVAGLEPIPGQSGFVNWDARELPDAALQCAASVRGSRALASVSSGADPCVSHYRK